MTGDPLRVLVVDDQQDSAEMLSMLLEDRGHVTGVAVDGPSALTLAEAFQPHVGLLDLGLPGMSGFELAMRLRAVPGLEHVRLVAVTGHGSDAVRVLQANASASGVLRESVLRGLAALGSTPALVAAENAAL